MTDQRSDTPDFSDLTPEQQALLKEAMLRSGLDVDALFTVGGGDRLRGTDICPPSARAPASSSTVRR